MKKLHAVFFLLAVIVPVIWNLFSWKPPVEQKARIETYILTQYHVAENLNVKDFHALSTRTILIDLFLTACGLVMILYILLKLDEKGILVITYPFSRKLAICVLWALINMATWVGCDMLLQKNPLSGIFYVKIISSS
jgi:hypothetical protein